MASERNSENFLPLRDFVDQLVDVMNGPNNPVDVGDYPVYDDAGFVVVGVVISHEKGDGVMRVVIDTQENL